MITSVDGGSSWTAALPDPSGVQWAVISADYNAVLGDFSASGFTALDDATLQGAGLGVGTAPADAGDLVTPRTILRVQSAGSGGTTTTLDTLTISDTTEGAGSFTIAAAPAPGTLALLGVGGLVGWRLRRRIGGYDRPALRTQRGTSDGACVRCRSSHRARSAPRRRQPHRLPRRTAAPDPQGALRFAPPTPRR